MVILSIFLGFIKILSFCVKWGVVESFLLIYMWKLIILFLLIFCIVGVKVRLLICVWVVLWMLLEIDILNFLGKLEKFLFNKKKLLICFIILVVLISLFLLILVSGFLIIVLG